MIILGIETSCDETAASVVEYKNNKKKVLSNILYSQFKEHRPYGGVVPEIAFREHIKLIDKVILQALKVSKKKFKNIDAVAATVDRYGRLDVTVNNAGMSTWESRKNVEDTTLEIWNRMHAVNATGVFLGTKHSIPEMRKVGGGSIINISSIYGIVGSKGGTSYHSAKGGVRTFTKATAIQYASENIRSNSIHPGFADTGMTAELHAQPDEHARRISQTPLGRMGTPEDMAWGCLYLASDESSFVTGVELPIDGGMTAQ